MEDEEMTGDEALYGSGGKYGTGGTPPRPGPDAEWNRTPDAESGDADQPADREPDAESGFPSGVRRSATSYRRGAIQWRPQQREDIAAQAGGRGRYEYSGTSEDFERRYREMSRASVRRGPSRYGYGPYHNRLRRHRRDDDVVKRDVEEALFFDTWVDADRIQVAVDDGVVTLSGTLPEYREVRYATDDAWDVDGVRGVRARLEVDETGGGADSGAEFEDAREAGGGAGEGEGAKNSQATSSRGGAGHGSVSARIDHAADRDKAATGSPSPAEGMESG